jgi:hypothetical protein
VIEDETFKLPEGTIANLRLAFGQRLTREHLGVISYVYNNRSDLRHRDGIQQAEDWLDWELGSRFWDRWLPKSQPSLSPPPAPPSAPQHGRQSARRDEIRRIARLCYPPDGVVPISTFLFRKQLSEHWDPEVPKVTDKKTINRALGREDTHS